MNTTRHLQIVVAAAALFLCSGCDTHPTSGSAALSGGETSPFLTMSAEDAYSLTNTYLDQDPLEPFGVTYEAFFQNPGIISDQQFIDQAAATDFTVDPSLIESDGEAVSAYAASCAAGAGGGSPDQIMGSGDCERMYNACAARVRMIPTARARALAWAACMAAYAACRGIQEVK